jgi:hypothetical protein
VKARGTAPVKENVVLAASLDVVLGYAPSAATLIGIAAGFCPAGIHAALTTRHPPPATRRTQLSTHLALGPPLLFGAFLVLASAA